MGLKELCGRRMGGAGHPDHVFQGPESVQVNGQYSEGLGVGVGVHQDSGLSPLLFVLVYGSSSMLMNWCSSLTPKRGVYPSSRRGRLAWKVKSPMLT